MTTNNSNILLNYLKDNSSYPPKSLIKQASIHFGCKPIWNEIKRVANQNKELVYTFEYKEDSNIEDIDSLVLSNSKKNKLTEAILYLAKNPRATVADLAISQSITLDIAIAFYDKIQESKQFKQLQKIQKKYMTRDLDLLLQEGLNKLYESKSEISPKQYAVALTQFSMINKLNSEALLKQGEAKQLKQMMKHAKEMMKNPNQKNDDKIKIFFEDVTDAEFEELSEKIEEKEVA